MVSLELILTQIDDPDLRHFLDLATSPDARFEYLQRLIKKDKRWRARIKGLLLMHKAGASNSEVLDELIDSLDLSTGFLKINSKFARQFVDAQTIARYETVFGTLLDLYSERAAQSGKKKIKGKR